MCCVQLPNGPTSFKSIFVKPYLRSKNTYDVKPDELEALTELDELEAPPPTLEVPKELTEPVKPTIKYG